MTHPTFVVTDYVVFALMLLLSVAIGIYYAHRGRKRNQKALGYLLANRSVGYGQGKRFSTRSVYVYSQVYDYDTCSNFVIDEFQFVLDNDGSSC